MVVHHELTVWHEAMVGLVRQGCTIGRGGPQVLCYVYGPRGVGGRVEDLVAVSVPALVSSLFCAARVNLPREGQNQETS